MKTPPFLMLGALLFWGWQTGLLVWGAALGAAFELSHWAKGRLDFSDKEFHRVWDLCALLFISAGLYLRFTEVTGNSAYYFFQWFPIVFFPMALAQAFSARGQVPVSAFSWYMRKKKTGKGKGVDVAWVYFALCLISAGAANRRDPGYYIGGAALTGIALWWTRPRRFSQPVWLGSFAAVVGLGYFGHVQINRLQMLIEARTSDWFTRFSRKEFDSSESRTSMGKIGSLKESGRIVLKVKGEQTPGYLRQASYTLFKEATWAVRKSDFTAITSEQDPSVWNLLPDRKPAATVEVSGYLTGGRKGLLSLPLGTIQITNLIAGEMQANHLGAVRINEGPAFFDYWARYGPGASIDSEPDAADDLEVPAKEKEALAAVVKELNLGDVPAEEKLRRIERFFQEKFRYTTWLKGDSSWKREASPVSEFLLRRREGHCEYFASATVLLLRQLGIPARYATGYSVQERAKNGAEYIVRERHAHAWVLAHYGGAWRDFDTTPASWFETEQNEASFFEPVSDFFSKIQFAFSQWRWSEKKAGVRRLVPILIVALILYLVWRIVWGRKRVRNDAPRFSRRDLPGGDSEFYLVEKRLQNEGLGRREGEPLRPWVQRIEAARPGAAAGLQPLLQLHCRYRFDPRGLSAAERARLKKSAQTWLARTTIAPRT